MYHATLEARTLCAEIICAETGDTRAFSKYSAPELWHLLSLDAPTVAVLWTVFLAQCTGIHLGWSLPVCLFLAVWVLYAGDRLLDAQASPRSRTDDLLERHYFHRRYRFAFLAGISGCLLTLLLLLVYVDRGVAALYAAPGFLLAGWLVLIHGRRAVLPQQKPLPKELAVGLFFAAAIVLPTFAQAPALRWELLPSAFLLAAVCTLNCLFLYAWEHREYGDALQTHSTTRWGLRHLEPAACGTLALSLFFSLAMAQPSTGLPRGSETLARFGLACALAVLCLLVLHRHRRRFSPLALRVAADASLLTPLLFLHVHG